MLVSDRHLSAIIYQVLRAFLLPFPIIFCVQAAGSVSQSSFLAAASTPDNTLPPATLNPDQKPVINALDRAITSTPQTLASDSMVWWMSVYVSMYQQWIQEEHDKVSKPKNNNPFSWPPCCTGCLWCEYIWTWTTMAVVRHENVATYTHILCVYSLSRWGLLGNLGQNVVSKVAI